MSNRLSAGERAIWAAVFAKHYAPSKPLNMPPKHEAENWDKWEAAAVSRAIRRAAQAVRLVRESNVENDLTNGSFALECWFDMVGPDGGMAET